MSDWHFTASILESDVPLDAFLVMRLVPGGIDRALKDPSGASNARALCAIDRRCARRDRLEGWRETWTRLDMTYPPAESQTPTATVGWQMRTARTGIHFHGIDVVLWNSSTRVPSCPPLVKDRRICATGGSIVMTLVSCSSFSMMYSRTRRGRSLALGEQLPEVTPGEFVVHD